MRSWQRICKFPIPLIYRSKSTWWLYRSTYDASWINHARASRDEKWLFIQITAKQLAARNKPQHPMSCLITFFIFVRGCRVFQCRLCADRRNFVSTQRLGFREFPNRGLIGRCYDFTDDRSCRFDRQIGCSVNITWIGTAQVWSELKSRMPLRNRFVWQIGLCNL